MTLSKEAILKADDLKTETVKVPEWGGSVKVRTLTGAERNAFEAGILAGGEQMNLQNVYARLCALVIVDDDGKRLFSDLEIAQLGRKSSLALNRIYAKAQEMNGLRQEDVEFLSKNSDSIHSDDSTSA